VQDFLAAMTPTHGLLSETAVGNLVSVADTTPAAAAGLSAADAEAV